MGEAILAGATLVLALGTLALVALNRGLLRATMEAAEAATKSADAAVQELLLTHRSYVVADNFAASVFDNQVKMTFDVVDAAGVPTIVESVRTRHWIGDHDQRPNTQMISKGIHQAEVYRDYSEKVRVDTHAPAGLVDGANIHLDVDIQYRDSASNRGIRWTCLVGFVYAQEVEEFSIIYYRRQRTTIGADTD